MITRITGFEPRVGHFTFEVLRLLSTYSKAVFTRAIFQTTFRVTRISADSANAIYRHLESFERADFDLFTHQQHLAASIDNFLTWCRPKSCPKRCSCEQGLRALCCMSLLSTSFCSAHQQDTSSWVLETFRCTSHERKPVWGPASGLDSHRSVLVLFRWQQHKCEVKMY